MLIKTFPVGPLACNCTILADENTGEAIVIDPGDETEKILNLISQQKYRVKHILHTHAHFDHIGATSALKEATRGEISLHKEDLFLYDNIKKQGVLFGLDVKEKVKPVDHYLVQDDVVEWGKEKKLEVLHTPGHTPGSLSFWLKDLNGKNCLFTGDTLFMGSIGRTDLWGGDFGQIIHSIKTRLLPLADDTLVIPGHGPQTTIGTERRSNPFLT